MWILSWGHSVYILLPMYSFSLSLSFSLFHIFYKMSFEYCVVSFLVPFENGLFVLICVWLRARRSFNVEYCRGTCLFKIRTVIQHILRWGCINSFRAFFSLSLWSLLSVHFAMIELHTFACFNCFQHSSSGIFQYAEVVFFFGLCRLLIVIYRSQWFVIFC